MCQRRNPAISSRRARLHHHAASVPILSGAFALRKTTLASCFVNFAARSGQSTIKAKALFVRRSMCMLQRLCPQHVKRAHAQYQQHQQGMFFTNTVASRSRTRHNVPDWVKQLHWPAKSCASGSPNKCCWKGAQCLGKVELADPPNLLIRTTCCIPS